MTGSTQVLMGGNLGLGAPAWNVNYKSLSPAPAAQLNINADGTMSKSGTGTSTGTDGFSRWWPGTPPAGLYVRITVTAGAVDLVSGGGAGVWQAMSGGGAYAVQQAIASSQSGTVTFDVSTTNGPGGIVWTSPGNIIARQYA